MVIDRDKFVPPLNLLYSGFQALVSAFELKKEEQTDTNLPLYVIVWP